MFTTDIPVGTTKVPGELNVEVPPGVNDTPPPNNVTLDVPVGITISKR
jgi:hypothetical protein